MIPDDWPVVKVAVGINGLESDDEKILASLKRDCEEPGDLPPRLRALR